MSLLVTLRLLSSFTSFISGWQIPRRSPRLLLSSSVLRAWITRARKERRTCRIQGVVDYCYSLRKLPLVSFGFTNKNTSSEQFFFSNLPCWYLYITVFQPPYCTTILLSWPPQSLHKVIAIENKFLHSDNIITFFANECMQMSPAANDRGACP